MSTQNTNSARADHLWPVRVYYEDTDLAGIVYHANYLKFMERGRSEFLRAVGIDQVKLAREDRYFVVRSMDVSFLRPARFDDELLVRTTMTSAKGASVALHQDVVRGEEVCCAATVRVALVSSAGKPKRLEPTMVAALGSGAS